MTEEDALDAAVPEALSDQAFERWLEQAEADPERSRELDFLADVTAAAGLAWAAQPAHRVRGSRLPSRIGPRIGPWLAAAAALLGTALIWWLARQGPATIPLAELAQRGAPPYFAIDLRGPGQGPDPGFDQAMTRYTRGEYGAAIPGLEAWLAQHPEHLPGRFFLAAALEQEGRLDEARREYARTAEAPGRLGEDALFRLANLHLLQGDLAAARAALTRLRERGGSFASKAEELLQRLAGR